ncbi:hypothetical protein M408DRAFT_22865 [Serendipita vermifera MAFF 305830]|uniref:Uncharacterized protein n=1 Tax=Serendipita vermifera MAFF 305830 TaxID=933852 RepID=A0A0C2XKF3_SERVB|nr:hypothetical protein M408DRAFT_22865 [Serendipita vermifera MAFF 305830]
MYTTRNLFYLKISNEVVLPLYVYLDQQHVHWMSDFVLQKVLRDLKPLQVHRIGPKIILEGDDLFHLGTKNPKATVEVVSEGYQFAFFFRKLEQHGILIKSRNFKLVPNPPSSRQFEQEESQVGASGVTLRTKAGVSTGKKGKKRARPIDSDEDGADDIEMLDDLSSNIPRSSRRKIRKVYTEDNDMNDSEGTASGREDDAAYIPDEPNEQDNGVPGIVKAEEEDIRLPPPSATDNFPIDIDEEEKPKMSMKLSYKGHSIPGRYLCVIVEPDPPLAPELAPRAESVLPPEVRFRPAPAIPRLRDTSEIPSSSRSGSVRLRSETPLFLPEHDDDDDSVRGSPPPTRDRNLPPVPLFGGPLRDTLAQSGEENTTSLLAFSQALTSVRHEDEGEDSDEDYLRGDADENQRILE